MERAKRILLVDRKNESIHDTLILLKVTGYDVEMQQDYFMAANSYSLMRETMNQFDLVVVILYGGDDHHLRDLLERKIFNKVLLFKKQRNCQNFFCRQGSFVTVCHPGALLSGVSALLEESK